MTAADLIVLALLSERPMHGYELVKEYERQEVEDWAEVSRPHVYYALKKLARTSLIQPIEDAAATGVRGRVVFGLTGAGSAQLADALADDRWATQRPPTPFTTWVGLSVHARPEDIRRVIAARRRFLSEQLTKEKGTLAEIEGDCGVRIEVAAAMVTLCIRQFELELAWLDELEQASSGS